MKNLTHLKVVHDPEADENSVIRDGVEGEVTMEDYLYKKEMDELEHSYQREETNKEYERTLVDINLLSKALEDAYCRKLSLEQQLRA